MTYSEMSKFQTYNLYTFYKGVCGGLVSLTQIWSKSKDSAIQTAKINGISSWDFIKEERFV